MKLRIFEEGKKVELEQEVYLRLKYGGSRNSVVVYACDEKGEPLSCGNLIAFYPDGTMKKMMGLNGNLGFQLDTGGQIEERGDC